MKKVVIVHCWGGYPEYCWYPNTKSQLESAGFEVVVPKMPDTDNPNLEKWMPVLKEAIGEPSKDIYLVGHSIGCATIMRYLESLPAEAKIGGVVFVAGFTDGLSPEFKEIQNFFMTPIDFEKIKSHCSKFIAIASDDDPYVPLKYADILKEKFGAEVIIKHNMKHFSGAADGEEACTELPEVVDAIEKMSK